MPWDGGGNFTREHDWTDDANSSIDIEAIRMDEEDDNFATGIEACLNKDGQNTAERVNVDNLRLDGNTLSSENTNGDINITPNGTGQTVTKNPVGDIAVSTTTSGGTSGLHYTVADWPDTLVSGRTYYARIHTANVGPYSIDPGGGAISVTRPDGTDPYPLDASKDTVLGFRYDGTNLIQTFIPQAPKLLATAVGSFYTRLCRISLFEQSGIYGCITLLRFWDAFKGISVADFGELRIDACQSDALGSFDTANDLHLTVSLGSSVSLAHNSFSAYVVSATASETIIDVYVTSNSGTLGMGFQPNVLDIGAGLTDKCHVTFFNDDGSDTEANITGGTFDVTSQAARGEVVTGSFTTASLASGATEDNTITHNLGTDNVTFDCIVNIVGVTSNLWSIAAVRPDGALIGRVGNGENLSVAGFPSTPSSGDVLTKIQNETGGTQTLECYWEIRVIG